MLKVNFEQCEKGLLNLFKVAIELRKKHFQIGNMFI